MRQLVWIFLGMLFLTGGITPLGGSLQAQENRAADAAAPAEDAVPADDAAAGEDAAAAEEAPAPVHVPQDKWDDAHSIGRWNYSLVSWPKLFSIWLLFVIWVKTGDWINKDT